MFPEQGRQGSWWDTRSRNRRGESMRVKHRRWRTSAEPDQEEQAHGKQCPWMLLDPVQPGHPMRFPVQERPKQPSETRF